MECPSSPMAIACVIVDVRLTAQSLSPHLIPTLEAKVIFHVHKLSCRGSLTEITIAV